MGAAVYISVFVGLMGVVLAIGPIAGQLFGARFTTDIDVSYTFLENYTVSVGASNLFNTYPDRVANSPDNRIFLSTNSLADGQIYPNAGGPFGFNGGLWYARIRVKY